MASWSLVAHAINGTAQGGAGPYKAPNGAGTVNATGADVYLVFVAYYNTGHTLVAGDLTDVSGNTYTLLTEQAGAGDTNVKGAWLYKLAPAVSAVEQWTVTNPAFVGFAALAFSGSNGASSTVTSAKSGTTSTTPSAGTGIGASGNLVVSAVGNYPVDSSSIDSSFAIVDHNAYTNNNNLGTATAWNNSSAGVGGSVDPVWTLSGAPTSNVVYNVSITPSGGGGGGRGLFRTPSLGGVGVGGSFFRDPLQAPMQMVRRDRIYVPARLAA